MSERFEPHAALHSKGLAVGWSDIRKDAIVFEFRKERFEIPTIKAFPFAVWNGYFYTAKIRDIRKIARG